MFNPILIVTTFLSKGDGRTQIWNASSERGFEYDLLLRATGRRPTCLNSISTWPDSWRDRKRRKLLLLLLLLQRTGNVRMLSEWDISENVCACGWWWWWRRRGKCRASQHQEFMAKAACSSGDVWKDKYPCASAATVFGGDPLSPPLQISPPDR